MKLRQALNTNEEVKRAYEELIDELRDDLDVLAGIVSNYPHLTASHIVKMAVIGARVRGMCQTIKHFAIDRG